MSNLPWLAGLIQSRNTIDQKIASIVGKTTQVQNVGEYIASIIFAISTSEGQKNAGYCGRFTNGPLSHQTVDVQWRPQRDGLLNIRPHALPDHYLVFVGPHQTHSLSNPWLIHTVYLFSSQQLMPALKERNVVIGSGTSITGPLWERAEIFPISHNLTLPINNEQAQLLQLFHG